MRRGYRLGLVAGAIGLVVGLGGVADAGVIGSRSVAPEVGEAEPAPACPLGEKLRPTCPGQALFGAWVRGYDGAVPQQVANATARYGRRVDIVHTYHAPDNAPIPFAKGTKWGDAERAYTAEGRIVLANFKPGITFKEVAEGLKDEEIKAAARNIADVKAPVMLALYHEPENDIAAYPGSTCASYGKKASTDNTPDNYRAMWQRTRALFDEAGATNVVWVMNYMSLEKFDCMVKDVWPGDDLVDWIAYDPYSRDGSVDTVTRFPRLLADNADATHHFNDKPLMLAEYGVLSCNKEEHVYPYYAALKKLVDDHAVDRLEALVVFDTGTATSGEDVRVSYDCNRAQDLREEAALRELATDPLLFPDLPAVLPAP